MEHLTQKHTIKKAKSLAEIDYVDADVSFLTIGKKGSEFFTKNGFTVRSSHDSLYDDLTFEKPLAIAEEIMKSFLSGEFDKVILVYNQFKNAATQLVQSEQFLPSLKHQQKKVLTIDLHL